MVVRIVDTDIMVLYIDIVEWKMIVVKEIFIFYYQVEWKSLISYSQIAKKILKLTETNEMYRI